MASMIEDYALIGDMRSAALPGRQASWPQWAGALNAWREQRRVPLARDSIS